MAKKSTGGMTEPATTATPTRSIKQPGRHPGTGRFTKTAPRKTKRAAKRK